MLLYSNCQEIADELGIPRHQVYSRLRSINVFGPDYMGRYSEHVVNQLREDFLVPDGYMTIMDISKKFGIKKTTLEARINRRHIEPAKIRGAAVRLFNQQQVNDIIKIRIEPPKKKITLQGIAKEAGVKIGKIRRRMSWFGMNTSTMTEADVEIIKNSLQYKTKKRFDSREVA